MKLCKTIVVAMALLGWLLQPVGETLAGKGDPGGKGGTGGGKSGGVSGMNRPYIGARSAARPADPSTSRSPQAGGATRGNQMRPSGARSGQTPGATSGQGGPRSPANAGTGTGSPMKNGGLSGPGGGSPLGLPGDFPTRPAPQASGATRGNQMGPAGAKSGQTPGANSMFGGGRTNPGQPGPSTLRVPGKSTPPGNIQNSRAANSARPGNFRPGQSSPNKQARDLDRAVQNLPPPPTYPPPQAPQSSPDHVSRKRDLGQMRPQAGSNRESADSEVSDVLPRVQRDPGYYERHGLPE